MQVQKPSPSFSKEGLGLIPRKGFTENPALGAHSLFKTFYPISNMAVAVEVARVRGAMLNRGYYSRISYVEPPLPELSPVKTSIKSDFNLYDLIKETQEYCRTERAKILEQLKKYKK